MSTPKKNSFIVKVIAIVLALMMLSSIIGMIVLALFANG